MGGTETFIVHLGTLSLEQGKSYACLQRFDSFQCAVKQEQVTKICWNQILFPTRALDGRVLLREIYYQAPC